MEQRIPTQPLAEERTELAKQILASPAEIQYQILGQKDDFTLLNICLANTQLLSYCQDVALKLAKGWTAKEFIIFRLKLLLKCQSKLGYGQAYIRQECQPLKQQLYQELLTNQEFTDNYNKIVEYSSIGFHPRSNPVKDDTIHILINIINLNFRDDFNHPIDLSYLVNLRIVKFGNSFNQSFILPDNTRKLTMGPNFMLPLTNLPASLLVLQLKKSYPLLNQLQLPPKAKLELMN